MVLPLAGVAVVQPFPQSKNKCRLQGGCMLMKKLSGAATSAGLPTEGLACQDRS